MRLCTEDDPDPKWAGTLTHRIWTCAVLQEHRERLVPGWLLRSVTSKLRSGFSPEELLLFTRALMKSPEPRLEPCPADETFVWVHYPFRGDIGVGTVYVDGSRLYAEHRLAGLLARQGWAFAIYDRYDELIAAAKGRTAWWASGIFAAEAWALHQGTMQAFPGSTYVADCLSVVKCVSRGTSWANAPSRKYGRLLAQVVSSLDDGKERVAWMPSHTTEASVGQLHLSNGTRLSVHHRKANGYVDRLAKSVAIEDKPPKRDFAIVNECHSTVTAVAKWIGVCTELANHYPVPRPEDASKIMYIRDSSAQRPKRSDSSVAPSVKPASRTRDGTWDWDLCDPAREGPASKRLRTAASDRRPAPTTLAKCKFDSQASLHEQTLEAAFQESWHERVGQLPRPPPPVISAAERLDAIRRRRFGQSVTSLQERTV